MAFWSVDGCLSNVDGKWKVIGRRQVDDRKFVLEDIYSLKILFEIERNSLILHIKRYSWKLLSCSGNLLKRPRIKVGNSAPSPPPKKNNTKILPKCLMKTPRLPPLGGATSFYSTANGSCYESSCHHSHRRIYATEMAILIMIDSVWSQLHVNIGFCVKAWIGCLWLGDPI